MEAIILAAGKGTRMRGLCEARPKPMLPLANRPILDITLDHLAAAGIERAFVVVGHYAEQIAAHLESRRPPIPVEIILQPEPNGTGSAALLGRGRMKEQPFLLAFGDVVVSGPNYAALVRTFEGASADMVLSTRHVDDPWRGAAVHVDANGFVTRIVEKPPRGTSSTHYDSAGLFCFSPRIWDLLERIGPSPRGEYELTDAIAATLAEGGRIRTYELAGYWLNLTGPEELLRANAYRLAEVDPAACPPCAVDPSARLGDCRVGPNVSVGPGCRVEDGAVVEDAILMERALVGARAVVRHAILGADSQARAACRLEGSEERAALLLDGRSA